MPISIGGFLFSMVLAQREGITDSTRLTQAVILGAVLGFSPIGIIATAELVNQQAQNATAVPPTPSVSGQFITATAGSQFSGTVATVVDPAVTQPGQLGATIDWGDKSPTSSGTVSGADGTFTVTGSHTYASTTADSFTITVSVTDAATNQTGNGSGTAMINPLPTEQVGGQAGVGKAPATVMSASQEIGSTTRSAIASPAKVRVPSLHGKTYAEAREVLYSHDLQAKRKDEEGEKDRVIRQEPHAETLVDARSTVTLYIGKGKDFEEFEELTRQE